MLTTLKPKLKKFIKQHKRLYAWTLKLKNRLEKNKFHKWFSQNTSQMLDLISQRATKFNFMPLISIIVPVYNPQLDYLSEMLDSVLAQTYSHWELCIADGKSNLQVVALLAEYARRDPRIKISYLEQNYHICGNSNQALELASGDFIALLDHDDLLAPECLYKIVLQLNAEPAAELLYTDEGFYSRGKHLSGHFKPDFAPDTLRETNYITHFVVFKRGLLSQIGSPVFREEFLGAQDYDLIFRLSEHAERIVHIPHILYHWRMHSNSSLGNPASKEYAYVNGVKAIQAHLERIGRKAEVSQRKDLPGIYKVKYALNGRPLISIIIPNKDHSVDLRKCIAAIQRLTTYPYYEIIVVENNSHEPETLKTYQDLEQQFGVKVVYYPEEGFNYARINNWGVDSAGGEFLVFLNNDTEVITPDWLQELLMYAQFKEIAAVGAKLYFFDDTIQHAGLVIGPASIPGNLFDSYPQHYVAKFARTHRVQNLSAVTAACMLVAKTKFLAVGKFDENLAVAFNDVDLCLKFTKEGWLNVFNPDAELYHYESKSRGYEHSPEKLQRYKQELAYFRQKWGENYRDPYYNQVFRKYNYSW